MKRFFARTIIFLIFIAATGGTAFFFGWVEYRLEPGESALLFSKTSGWDDDVFTSGKNISWKWELLIPRNATLYPLNTSQRSISPSFSFELPSGSLYAQYLEGSPSFIAQGTLRISYRIDPASLHTRITTTQTPPEEDFFQIWEEEVNILAKNQISLHIASGLEDRESIQEALAQDLETAFPELSFTGVSISSLSLPDSELYAQARNNYAQLIQLRQQQFLSLAQATTESRQQFEEKVRRIEEISRILADNAAIFEYLQITGGTDPLQILD